MGCPWLLRDGYTHYPPPFPPCVPSDTGLWGTPGCSEMATHTTLLPPPLCPIGHRHVGYPWLLRDGYTHYPPPSPSSVPLDTGLWGTPGCSDMATHTTLLPPPLCPIRHRPVGYPWLLRDGYTHYPPPSPSSVPLDTGMWGTPGCSEMATHTTLLPPPLVFHQTQACGVSLATQMATHTTLLPPPLCPIRHRHVGYPWLLRDSYTHYPPPSPPVSHQTQACGVPLATQR